VSDDPLLLDTHVWIWVREGNDPGDRFLIATAQRLNARLVTADEKILAYSAGGGLRVLDPADAGPRVEPT